MYTNELTETDKDCIDNTTKHCDNLENDDRDDECVIIENAEIRNDIEDVRQINMNTIHILDGNIYLFLNGDDFKLIDVPGDGDCFFHSVLEYDSIKEKFSSVQELRQYMKYIVAYYYGSDRLLQYLFSFEK